MGLTEGVKRKKEEREFDGKRAKHGLRKTSWTVLGTEIGGAFSIVWKYSRNFCRLMALEFVCCLFIGWR